ncbi:M4 family metallopeptidase [Massilia sp. CF038]|uniref:M4 family metallopeptidase n=1 Tax=Massilia sp. CF038 TaxID=1881045 RepID=UPI001E3EE5BC|nr:M4 family metallopeptidase [Massilia sp. CF038]
MPIFAATEALASGPIMGAPVVQSKQQASTLVAKLDATRGSHGLDTNHSFAIMSQHPGVTGTKITRAAHTYKGVPIFQSESVIVTDDRGSIISESVSDRRAGLGATSGAQIVGAKVASLDVKPSVTSSAAIDSVVRKVGAGATHHAPPSAQLVVFPIMKTVRVPGAEAKAEAELNAMDLTEQVAGYELAYVVKTRMINGNKAIYHDTIVSAKTGQVLQQWQSLQTVVGVGNSQYNGQVPIETTLSGSNYTMKDSTRGTGGTFGGMAITNANHTTSAGSIYTNSTNTWGDGKQYINGGSTTNANGQTAAVNALWGLMNTYDTLKNVLGWQSLDGNNTATYIAAHVNTAYDNAYYSDTCRCMFIGDGGSSFNSLGAIDVIGHEMGHGVTAATSNLTYSGESGGLNESHSDIQGEMVEAYARNGGTGSVIPGSGNDWMTGKEISKSGNPLRWLYKPSKDGRSPDAWSSTIKNLDVHLSSGPNNRMFYFLAQGSNATAGSDYYSQYLNKSPAAMTGIGSDKAFRIWFKANTTKFTSSTNYADARNKTKLAAEELYGVGSKEAIAVVRAYAAINVGTDVDENGGGTPGAVSISSQPSSVSVAAGATASFSVTATGGTAPYKYQWRRNGASIAGATSQSYSLTAQTSDNGAVFSVVVTDSASSPTTATSSGATLTVGSTGGSVERVTNGGFESGTTGWSGTTGAIGTFSQQPAFEGTRNAWLGGNGVTATETISQSVAIPSNASSATLTFALHIDTKETTTSTAYDKLTVTATAGGVAKTLASYSNLNKAAGYQTRTFDLAAYKGQTVTLTFSMREDSSLQTSFAVDKVSVITQ